MNIEKHNRPNLIVIISLASALGAFSTGFAYMLFEDLRYVDATALGGIATIPGLLGGLIGSSIFFLLKRHKKIAITLGFSGGMAVYTLLLSITAEPVNGLLPFLAIPKKPVLAALIGSIGGIAGGFTLTLFSPLIKIK